MTSEDGTGIAFHSVGHGPGLVIVGGVLSTGSDYLSLAGALASSHEVHVMERRGRPGSGRQRADHSFEDECADLAAVAAATGSTAAFGHSVGGVDLRRPVPSLDRFSTISARTVLLGGAKSPEVISSRLLHELAAVIPHSTVMMLPGLGHLAPEKAGRHRRSRAGITQNIVVKASRLASYLF